jgi:hypothetical protein
MKISNANWAVIINQNINLFYTAVFFFPIIVFWFRYYSLPVLLIFAGFSTGVFFLPPEFYSFFQLSRSKTFYERFAIHKFQHLTQNGKYSQQLIKYFTGENQLGFKKQNIRQLSSQIRTFESFHWACFLFFMATFIYAFSRAAYISALLIFVANIFYNIIPILIQQYNRTRLNNIFK